MCFIEFINIRKSVSEVVNENGYNDIYFKIIKGDSAGGQPPYGLKVVNKQYEIDEDEAPAVKLIFSMIAKRKQLSGRYQPSNQARL